MNTKLYLASVAPLRDAACFARLLETVPPARREKVLRCRSDGAQRLLLGAGVLLRMALAAEGLTAGDYALTPEEKPFFPDLPGFHFNLSHSGETVLCAVSDRPLGCDVEGLRPFDPALPRRFFHPEECAWLFSLPAAEQPAAFMRLWTLKESYVKALGVGLTLPLCDFAFSLSDGVVLTHAADSAPWRFLSFREGDSFFALCAPDAGPDTPILRPSLTS